MTRSQYAKAKAEQNICVRKDHNWCLVWVTNRIKGYRGYPVAECSICKDILVDGINQKLVTDALKYVIREDIKCRRTYRNQKKFY
jgi:hypothetical protein